MDNNLVTTFPHATAAVYVTDLNQCSKHH